MQIPAEFNLTKAFKATKLEVCPSAASTTVIVHKGDGATPDIKSFVKGEKIDVSVELAASNAQATSESLKEVDWIHVSRWLAGWGQQGGQVRFLRFLSICLPRWFQI
jgi:hypothetical protein